MNWFYNSAPLSFSGNQYEVDIEKIGNYRVTVMEAWAGGPVCSATSSLVTIQALASNKLFRQVQIMDGLKWHTTMKREIRHSDILRL